MSFPDWRGRTVVCIASGPSLTEADCLRVRGLTTVVTNTTFRMCPWADALFAFDAKWWRLHIEEVRETFKGRLFCHAPHVVYRGVECLAPVRHFKKFGSSGPCAISLAIGFGASKIVMLGYDCQKTDGKSHHHGDHPEGLTNCASIDRWPGQFAKLAAHAKSKGVTVLNASRATALDCFPLVSLDDELSVDHP